MRLWVMTLVVLVLGVVTPSAAGENDEPYGSSTFSAFDGIDRMEQLKLAFDFNFADPNGVQRALHPVSFMLKATHEYGPVSFEPVHIVVVSHGSEVVVWAKQNYQEFKDIVDRAARLAEMGVKFEVCAVAASVLGFEAHDFHGFVRVVPTGTYALAYHQNRGYAVVPGAATIPGPIVNRGNRGYLGKKP